MARGQIEFTAGNTIKMALLLVMAIGFTLLISNQSGGIRDIMEGVCEKHADIIPFCQKPQIETLQHATAKRSFDALVCAIDSVAVGELSCEPDFYAEDSGAVEGKEYIVEYKETKATFRTKDEKCVDEDGKGICYDEFCNGLPGCEIEAGFINTEGRNTCMCSVKMPTKSTVECKTTDDGYKCTVSNFDLPQEVTVKEEWIPWFGDPQIMLYFEKFPLEEDTWNMKTDWRLYAAIGVISVIPFFKFGKAVIGAGIETVARGVGRLFVGNVIKEGTETVLRKTVTTAVVKRAATRAIKDAMKKGIIGEEGNTVIRKMTTARVRNAMSTSFNAEWKNVPTQNAPEIAKKYVEDATLQTLIDAGAKDLGTETFTQKIVPEVMKKASQETMRELAKTGLKAQLGETIASRLYGKSVPTTIRKYVVLSTAAHIAAVIDGMFMSRFETAQDQLVFKEAAKSIETTTLSKEAADMPILVNIQRETAYLWNQKMRFHLVSPCQLTNLTVEKMSIRCENYTINDIVDEDGIKNRITSCDGNAKARERGDPCDPEQYDVGDYGPLEFLESLDKIPESIQTVYNDKIPIDQGRTAYPVLEYDAGSCWGSRCKKVLYIYKDGVWKWKSPELGANKYTSIPHLTTDDDWEIFRSVYNMGTVHKDIMRNLTSDFNAGMIGLRDILAKDDDSSGTNVKNDIINVYNYRNEPIKITHDNPDELLSLGLVSMMMENYYTVPVSENIVLYYSSNPEMVKIGKIVGSSRFIYDTIKVNDDSDKRKYEPADFPDIDMIEAWEFGRTYADMYNMYTNKYYIPGQYSQGLIEWPTVYIKIDVPEWKSTLRNDLVEAFIDTDDTDVRMINMRAISKGLLGSDDIDSSSVTISDLGDDGITRAFYFHKKSTPTSSSKVLMNKDSSNDEIDYYFMTQCVTEGIVVVPGEKIGGGPNYCTSGLTGTETAISIGGDVLMVGGIIGSVVAAPFTAGTSLSWIPATIVASTGVAQTATKYVADKGMEWPNSW